MLETNRDDWRFALWSSLALELLARAALAKISPALLAEPKDWNNLLFAIGLSPTAKRFTPKSITTSEVLSRLREIVPEFDAEMEGFCLLHTNKRNSELHSGDLPFDGVKNSFWLPKYYGSSKVLLQTMGVTLNEFLGKDEAKVAEKLIEAAADDAAKAAIGTVEAHRKVWEAKAEEAKVAGQTQATAWATRHMGHRVKCPACRSDAAVVGDPISSPQKSIKGDIITETQQYLPNKFECVACGLKLAGLAHLNACELGDTYIYTQQYDAAEYYGAQEPEWEPDNNE